MGSRRKSPRTAPPSSPARRAGRRSGPQVQSRSCSRTSPRQTRARTPKPPAPAGKAGSGLLGLAPCVLFYCFVTMQSDSRSALPQPYWSALGGRTAASSTTSRDNDAHLVSSTACRVVLGDPYYATEPAARLEPRAIAPTRSILLLSLWLRDLHFCFLVYIF